VKEKRGDPRLFFATLVTRKGGSRGDHKRSSEENEPEKKKTHPLVKKEMIRHLPDVSAEAEEREKQNGN